MIYMPSDSTFNKCYVVQSEGVIRGYDHVPQNNLSYNYRDYYINSDYIYRDGTGTWSQYTTLPTCLSSSVITDEIYYRVDFYKTLIILVIFFLFIVYFPVKIFTRLFGRWLKC